jgi:hypothetical protein
MCLRNRKELEAPITREGFKLFAKNKSGKLYSPFATAHDFKAGTNNALKLAPNFPMNQIVHVNPEDRTFFSFEKFDDACRVASNTGKWNFIGDTIVVRPVTAIDIVVTGDFFAPSDDPQCLDGYYPSYESKKLIVHDTPEIEREINEKLVKEFVERHRWGLSYMQEEAFQYFLAK